MTKIVLTLIIVSLMSISVARGMRDIKKISRQSKRKKRKKVQPFIKQKLFMILMGYGFLNLAASVWLFIFHDTNLASFLLLNGAFLMVTTWLSF